MISFLRLLFKFVETNLSDACLWSKFLFHILCVSHSPVHSKLFQQKSNSVAFFALRINTCVCKIFHVLCSHAFELDVCYFWQAKHNVTWKICRKKDRKQWDAGAKFIRFDLIYVRFTTTSGSWPKAKYQQQYQTVQQLVDFSQRKWKKCQDGWNISWIPNALLWNCNPIFGDKRKLTFLFSVCSLLPLNL